MWGFPIDPRSNRLCDMTGTPDPASGKVMDVAPCAVGLRPREQLEFRPASVGAAQFALSPAECTAHGPKPTSHPPSPMSASLIGRSGSSASRLSIHQCGGRCRSRARASLRNRHWGPSIMGYEEEAEQSLGRPCRQCDGRSKRTYELTSSIVPRGTSFHSVEL